MTQKMKAYIKNSWLWPNGDPINSNDVEAVAKRCDERGIKTISKVNNYLNYGCGFLRK